MIKKEIVELPISLSDIKQHLRIEQSYMDDDEYLENLEKVAIKEIHNYVNGDLVYTKNTLSLSKYTGDNIIIDEPNFNVETTPIVSGSTGDIYDSDNGYEYNRTYVIIYTESIVEETPITLIFYTGYKNDDLPEDIKNIILQKITNKYDNERGDYNLANIKNNNITEKLLDYYKVTFIDTYKNYEQFI